MKVGDRVKHKRKGLVGTIYEIANNAIFVDWSDINGVLFRWARKKDLEVIDESR